MSAFYPFRGGSPKADIVRFFYRFSFRKASLKKRLEKGNLIILSDYLLHDKNTPGGSLLLFYCCRWGCPLGWALQSWVAQPPLTMRASHQARWSSPSCCLVKSLNFSSWSNLWIYPSNRTPLFLSQAVSQRGCVPIYSDAVLDTAFRWRGGEGLSRGGALHRLYYNKS